MKGYLNSEEETKKKVFELADYFQKKEIKESKIVQLKIFTETFDCGINIYTQVIGDYFNGPLQLKHTITWKCIAEYQHENSQF
jgi:hypothetical protein